MSGKILISGFLWLGCSSLAAAQSPPATPPTSPSAAAAPASQWRNPQDARGGPAATTARAPAALGGGPNSVDPIEPLRAINGRTAQRHTNVTQGPATLPNQQGQVWREYDITPYTVRVTSTNRPEQSIVDWILRDTGYEAWHSEPLGILCANRRSLTVYHTPEMQAIVGEVVDRFVSTEAESQAFGLRVITIDSPNWRAKAHAMLRPVAVQTQGIQAWLLQKEDAALLLADLRKRIDYREHSSPHLVVNNGQTANVTTARPRSYVRDVTVKPQAWPNYEPEYGQFEEGFSLELNPLLALDGRTVDAVIKCNIDQIEKLVSVGLDVPSSVSPRQRTQIEVPQVVHCRMHERFRWPTDQVLLVGLGVVASPVPDNTHPLLKNVPMLGPSDRADLLVFVESKGRVTPAPAAAGSSVPPQAAQRDTYRGRY
jgi:hypothetical protein